MGYPDIFTPPRGRAFRRFTFRLPFRNSSSSVASSSKNQNKRQLQNASTTRNTAGSSSSNVHIPNSFVSFVRSVIPAFRLLKLDISDKLCFPYEPGNEVRTAVKITNTSKSHVAFKLQLSTANYKDCYMRNPQAILVPGASIITTVHWHPEKYQKPMEMTGKIQFMLICLKVQGITNNVSQLFVEQKHKVIMQQKLKAFFLDSEHPALIQSRRLLVEADDAYFNSFPYDDEEGAGMKKLRILGAKSSDGW